MKHADLRWAHNPAARGAPFQLCDAAADTYRATEPVRKFHGSLPGYRPTPLVRLDGLARALGVRAVWVKDESHRMQLGAFKVLGGAYAVARELTRRLGADSIPAWGELQERVRVELAGLTLATATDGNHGHGLAWVARQLGLGAVVYLPAGCAQSRFERIASQGARVVRTQLSYDGAVSLAAAEARENGWVLVQDTSWDGYTQIPDWIQQGYLTVMQEAAAQWQAANREEPTHVLVQAGVGSFAAAVVSYLAARWGEARPRALIVEPASAACLLRSMQAGDGRPRAVQGRTHTMMAGLDCGTPNPRAWEILRSHADGFIACADEFAARGMRVLASPSDLDLRVTAGESGAVGVGVLSALRLERRFRSIASNLGLDQDSAVLLFNTEGDTDPDNYRRVVWDGAHPYSPGGRTLRPRPRRPRPDNSPNPREVQPCS
jgi:diaminopropionate ammonia-lyase